MEINWKKVGRHLLFWVCVFFYYVFSDLNDENFSTTIIRVVFKFPLLIISAYILNYWQVPFYLKRKKYWHFAISMVVVTFVLTVLYHWVLNFLLVPLCDDANLGTMVPWSEFLYYMLTFHFPAMIMFFYKSSIEQEKEREKLFKLENEKISTELKYLKAQLNPHFLFNTLNNLYSFIINKSPKAPDMVIQLSEILDYMLYKSQGDRVLLKDEIRTIRNYLELEKIRYGDRITVSFESNITNELTKTAPLLLLSIVENAFKHGVSKGTKNKPIIKISITEKDDTLEFNVWNTKAESNDIEKEAYFKNGIGLKNILRQLDLIYPDKHIISIEELKESFNLKLVLT